MEKSSSIIIVIILGIIIFGLGIGLGSMMKKAQPCRKVSTSSSCTLDSKIARNWTGFAIGEVKEITGRDFVLTSGEETLKVSILETARIQTLGDNGLKDISFDQIKVGDKVEIQFIFISEGKNLLGSVVTLVK